MQLILSTLLVDYEFLAEINLACIDFGGRFIQFFIFQLLIHLLFFFFFSILDGKLLDWSRYVVPGL